MRKIIVIDGDDTKTVFLEIPHGGYVTSDDEVELPN